MFCRGQGRESTFSALGTGTFSVYRQTQVPPDASVSSVLRPDGRERHCFRCRLTLICTAVRHRFQFRNHNWVFKIFFAQVQSVSIKGLICFKNMWLLSLSHWRNPRTFPKMLQLHKIFLKFFLQSYFQSLEPILWIVTRLANPFPLRINSILETACSQIWWVR